MGASRPRARSAAPTTTTTDADLEAVWATNVRAPHVLVAALAPATAGRGGGAVVNITSWMTQGGTAGVPAHSASGALDALPRD